MRRKNSHNYNSFWRKRKKYINISIAIGIILLALLIQLTISIMPESEKEILEKSELYCKNNCQSACLAKNTQLTSFNYTSQKCMCECSDHTKAVFGIDDFLE